MILSFKRDMTHNYMVTESEEILSPDDYQIHMLTENRIGGLLPCSIKKVNGKGRYFYDITSRQAMANIYEKEYIGAKDIRILLKGLYTALQETKKYLLDADRGVLEPEMIYMDIETKEPLFCYLPVYEGTLHGSFGKLAEYIMRRLDQDDSSAVLLGYEIYRQSLEENYSLEKLLKKAAFESGAARRGDAGGARAEQPGRFGSAKQAAAWRPKGETGEGAPFSKAWACKEFPGQDFPGWAFSEQAFSEEAFLKQGFSREGITGQANNGQANNWQANNGQVNNGQADNGHVNNGQANDGQANDGQEHNGVRRKERKEKRKKERRGQREQEKQQKEQKGQRTQKEKKAGKGRLLLLLALAAAVCAAAWMWELDMTQLGGIVFLLAALIGYGISAETKYRKKAEDKLRRQEERADRRSVKNMQEAEKESAKRQKAEAQRQFAWQQRENVQRQSAWQQKEEVQRQGEEAGWQKEEARRQKDEGRREKEAQQEDTGQQTIGATVLLDKGEEEYEPHLSLISMNPRDRNSIVLLNDSYTVGKLKSRSDIYIDDPSISRLHARIRREGKEYWLCDLNSTNGTFVNGRRLAVNESVPIRLSDEIRFAGLGYYVGRC